MNSFSFCFSRNFFHSHWVLLIQNSRSKWFHHFRVIVFRRHLYWGIRWVLLLLFEDNILYFLNAFKFSLFVRSHLTKLHYVVFFLIPLLGFLSTFCFLSLGQEIPLFSPQILLVPKLPDYNFVITFYHVPFISEAVLWVFHTFSALCFSLDIIYGLFFLFINTLYFI